MSGHKSFKRLREGVVADPKRRERVEQLGRAYDAVLGLADLRQTRGYTQTQIAGSLEVTQPNVSKLEGKDDFHLSTLCNYVEALGGQLEVKAVFQDQTIDVALPCSGRSQAGRGRASGKAPA